MSKRKKGNKGIPTFFAHADPPPSVYSSLMTNSISSVYNLSGGRAKSQEQNSNETAHSAAKDPQSKNDKFEKRPQHPKGPNDLPPSGHSQPERNFPSNPRGRRNFKPNIPNRRNGKEMGRNSEPYRTFHWSRESSRFEHYDPNPRRNHDIQNSHSRFAPYNRHLNGRNNYDGNHSRFNDGQQHQDGQNQAEQPENVRHEETINHYPENSTPNEPPETEMPSLAEPITNEVEQMSTSNEPQNEENIESVNEHNVPTQEFHPENPLLNLKLSEFLNAICRRDGITEENVCHFFFKDLMSKLFSLKEELPDDIRQKIYRIISLLVKIGVQLQSTGDDKEEGEILEISTCESIDYGDPRLNCVTKMLKIDLEIERLMNLKKKLYSKTLTVNENDVLNPADDTVLPQSPEPVNVKEEIIPPSYFPEISVRSIFQEERERILRLKKEVIDERNTIEHIELLDDDDDTSLEQSILNPENSIENVPPIEPQPVEPPKLKRFKLPDKSTRISCVACFKKLCLLGLNNGKIMVLCRRTLRPLDDSASYFFSSPHTDKIVSIVKWNVKIVSVSADCSLNVFNWNKKSSTKVRVEQPISSVDVNEGILYVGTTEGYFCQIVLSTSQYKCKLIHVEHSSINSIKVVNEESGGKFMVMLTDKRATLREPSGVLLKQFYQSENLEGITASFPWNGILYGKESNVLYAGNTECNQRTELTNKISFIDTYNDMIVIGGYSQEQRRQGYIAFYSHDLLHELKSYEVRYKPSSCVVISDKKAIVASSQSVFIVKLDLESLETRISALPFLSK